MVGADTSSTQLAQDVAGITGVNHIRMVKTDDSLSKRQVWAPDNPMFVGKNCILQVEELVTTASSALLVRQGIRRQRRMCDSFFPILPVIVDRSDPDAPVAKVEESEVRSLLRLKIKNYSPENCPYCKAGSRAIKPKEGNNWQLLTAA